ncbi:MAG: Rrf2 family transcriptional regulator [Bdellovibrionales bacterium]|nr:Rrf2 family transcriptional regulator [Bdellovibrionales bacterium]
MKITLYKMVSNVIKEVTIMLDSHFDTTLKIMINLAVKKQEELNSESLAKSLETNPAFVRKIMAKLSRAGLIQTKRGQSGGVSLLKSPKEISLRDIYLAANEKTTSPVIKKSKAICPVSCSAQTILLKLSTQLEAAHLLILGRIKLSHLTKDIKNE